MVCRHDNSSDQENQEKKLGGTLEKKIDGEIEGECARLKKVKNFGGQIKRKNQLERGGENRRRN